MLLWFTSSFDSLKIISSSSSKGVSVGPCATLESRLLNTL